MLLYLQSIIELHKVDAQKRFLWIKILRDGSPMYIVGCYIPHHDSPFYARYGVDPGSPYIDLSIDAGNFMKIGHVLILGDMNA